MNNILTVIFYGKIIQIVKGNDGHYWVPVKQICDDIGIEFNRQRKRLKSHKVIKTCVVPMYHAGQQKRELFCIRKDYLGGWLFSIDTSRITGYEVNYEK